MTRNIKQTTGGREIEHIENRRYVAVVPMRWGDSSLSPGDEIPIEAGRNYASMIRQGLIQSVIVPGGAS